MKCSNDFIYLFGALSGTIRAKCDSQINIYVNKPRTLVTLEPPRVSSSYISGRRSGGVEGGEDGGHGSRRVRVLGENDGGAAHQAAPQGLPRLQRLRRPFRRQELQAPPRRLPRRRPGALRPVALGRRRVARSAQGSGPGSGASAQVGFEG